MGRRPLELTSTPGATPLTEKDQEGLIPSISTQLELNEVEKTNIKTALDWARKSRKLRKELLTVSGIFLLHKKMLEEVWEWAGMQRTLETTVGISPEAIITELKKACDDVEYWIKNNTYSWSETAVRFHHKLVFIHPFPNGNGRHARIAANLLLRYNNQPGLTWGKSDLLDADEIRSKYIKSLQEADKGSYEELIKFAES